MHSRIILAIALKDLKDAIRDGRVLIGLLMPLGLGLVYNVAMPEPTKPAVTIAIATSEPTALPDALRAVAASGVDLKFKNVPNAEAARAQVSSKTADIGLLVPLGFDVAVAAGASPTLVLVRPGGSQSFGADYVASALDAAVRQMAGQHAPAVLTTEITQPAKDFASNIINLGVRKYLVLGSLIMLIAMIAIYILPVLLTDEFEKKTAEALLMVGSQSDVVAAKLLVGLTYITISVPLLMLVTQMAPVNLALFFGAVVALSITLIGFGLLLGGLVRTVNQLNTWSTIPLLLVILPVFFVALDLPSWTQTVMAATPGNQAMRLMADGLTGQAQYGGWLWGFVVMAAWAAAGYALLIRTLGKREGS